MLQKLIPSIIELVLTQFLRSTPKADNQVNGDSTDSHSDEKEENPEPNEGHQAYKVHCEGNVDFEDIF
jgi:hypothetical protein